MRMRVGLRRAVVLLLASGSGALQASPAAAQVTAADSAAIVLETAQTFESRGRWDVAEALYRLIVERFPATAAAGVARQRLANPPDDVRLGDGRVALQVWSTLYGAWLGIAIPGALGAESSEPYGVGLLVGGPAGFIAGRSIGRSSDVTEGLVSAVSLGAWWGTWQGFGWREVFDIGVEERCDPAFGCFVVEDSGEETFTAMILGGAAGVTTAALLATRDITPGTGTAINFGALWGTWFGVATGVLVDLEDDALLSATLLGGNIGLATTAVLAPRWGVTRSRARLVSIAGVLGGLGGAGIDLLIQPDNEKVAIGIPLAGSIAGLAIGISATRGEDRVENGESGAVPPDLALLTRRDGRWRMGAPLPVPTVVRADRPDGTTLSPGVRVDLLRVRF